MLQSGTSPNKNGISMDRDALYRTLRQLAHFRIPLNRLLLNEQPLGSGGSGTIFLAKLQPAIIEPGKRLAPDDVAVKKLRANEVNMEPTRLAFRLAREMLVWSLCKHENILEFKGYHLSDDFETAYLVSPYMRNGSAEAYLTRMQPTIEERLALLRDTLEGLSYLHGRNPPIVHGDLKALNVLIKDNGRAVLCDFGLAALTQEVEARTGLTTSDVFRGTTRWCSPDLLETAKRTLKSDMWAWGCLALEMMSGNPPFSETKFDHVVMSHIMNGRTPEPKVPPQDWPEGLLPLLRECWSTNAKDRPDARTCISNLEVVVLPRGVREDYDISRFIIRISPNWIKSGIFSVIHEGTHTTVGAIALKRYIQGRFPDDEIEPMLEREKSIWSSLNHPHILKFLGTAQNQPHRYLASPFIRNGTCLDYIEVQRGVNRVRLLCEAADALAYLHESGIMHGRVRANKLLISDGGHVLLCGFGSSRVENSSATEITVPVQWRSPELLGDNYPITTLASDVYAFSMTIVEVLTGRVPFPHLLSSRLVKRAVKRGDRPENTPLISDGISYENAWAVAEACWSQQPEDRIPMSVAFQRLREDPSLV